VSTLTFEFPWPPRELSPNARVHWRVLAKARQQYKEDCGWLVYNQLWPVRSPTPRGPLLSSPVTAQVTFVNNRRRRDPDNHMAMLKAVWDAMVGVGLLEDDSKDHLRILDPKWEVGEPKVIVTLHGEGG